MTSADEPAKEIVTATTSDAPADGGVEASAPAEPAPAPSSVAGDEPEPAPEAASRASGPRLVEASSDSASPEQLAAPPAEPAAVAPTSKSKVSKARATKARTAAAAPAQPPTRELARPPRDGEEMVKKSVNFAPIVVDAAERWLREQRKTVRRPSLSSLIDAALHDLPSDVDALRELAGALPDSAYTAGPVQVGMRIRRTTAQAIEDAAFELSTKRSRTLLLWHCLSGAMVAQLAAEGIEVVTHDEQQAG